MISIFFENSRWLQLACLVLLATLLSLSSAYGQATIKDVKISPEEVKPGGTFVITYTINATLTSIINKMDVFLGASIQLPGNDSIDDPQNDKEVELFQGDNERSRKFKVPPDAPSGKYNLLVALYQDTDNIKGISSKDKRIDPQTYSRKLTVTSPTLKLTVEPSSSSVPPKEWGESVEYTITVEADFVPEIGATVAVKDNLAGKEFFLTTDNYGRAIYKTTVPNQKAIGPYDITFVATKSGYTKSDPVTRQVKVTFLEPNLRIAEIKVTGPQGEVQNGGKLQGDQNYTVNVRVENIGQKDVSK